MPRLQREGLAPEKEVQQVPQEQDLYDDCLETQSQRLERARSGPAPTDIVPHSQAEATELLRARVRAALENE